ncbi:hypothetical protein A0J61_03999 [Choanephora cucurbitarum]|uniref:Response regulatory domain-containing protein n=1 Tax=Choanephora cucurbitarum TaxID=101091 RepID=A0A1C7NFP7_9FUNG|nr:hypothetical protein A0J61_03999 [Choanephora cucurbitarum]
MTSQQNNNHSPPSAFLNATSALPTFSLPPNLNNRSIHNKQTQENKDDSDNKASSNRLTIADLTPDNLLRQTSEDNCIDIKLPDVTTSHLELSLLTREMKLLLLVATTCCLVSSCYLTMTSERSLLATASTGKWLLVMLWIVSDQHQPSLYSSYSIFLSVSAFCLWMFTMYGWSCVSIIRASQFGAVVSFVMVYRLSVIYRQLQAQLTEQQQQYHSKVQQVIDQAIEKHAVQRKSFLAIASQEMKDIASTIMATIEQFAPSSILSNTHELLSACSIAVPTTSISAINTMVKQTCHISSHFTLLIKLLQSSDHAPVQSYICREFDVGELIQSVGDALAGMSAKLGVHLIIYHMDDVLYYPNVMGDEDATRHALISLLKNMLEGCTPGACIEVGLSVAPIPDSDKHKVTFHITHTASPSIPPGLSAAPIPNTGLTVRLIHFIRGQMDMEDLNKNKTLVKLTLELSPGSNNEQRLLLIERQLSNVQFANEPTLEELNSFVTKLKGVRLILHAPEKSIFAKHLTSCLASWNTDISHLPVLGYSTVDEEGSVASDTTAHGTDSDTSVHSQQPIKTPLDIHALLSPSSRPINTANTSANTNSKIPSPAIAEEQIHSIPPAFILIDDDIMTFERKLKEFRDKPPVPSQQQQQQQTPTVPPVTPQLQSSQAQQTSSQQPSRRHRRTKSRSSLASDVILHGTVAVVFFSSLGNYKRVRDTIQWFSSIHVPGLPRVIVVPKPAGPRRFLTALHTAWRNAVVEPQFIPIATSPVSPFIGVTHLTPTAGTVPPEGLTPSAALTPHDATRFSPGTRRNRLHSPSGLHLESEKGNYFFDPLAARPNLTSSTNHTGSGMNHNAMLPPKLNTSPHLMAAKSNGLMGVATPISASASTAVGGLTTPKNLSSTPILGNNVNTANGKQVDLKRTFRSHSNNTFAPSTPSRRNLVDLARSPSSSGKQASPLLEDEKHLSMNDLATESLPPPIVNANHLPAFHGSSPHLEHIVSPKLDSQGAQIENTNPTTKVVTANTTGTSDASNDNTVNTKPKSKYNFKLSNRKRKEKSSQPEKQSPPITVLIVEDNMINQAILSTWMRKHKIKFSVASDGKEAVEKWKGGGFHLILMDIQLPVLDGIEATKMIRSIEKERKIGVLPATIDEVDEEAVLQAEKQKEEEEKIRQQEEEIKQQEAATKQESGSAKLSPSASSKTVSEKRVFQSPVIIVALTASSLESDRQAALAAGCNDFLTKPVSLEWLEKKIMEWGCMQALIDFEGWRKWKDKQNAPNNPFLKQPQPLQKRDSQDKEQQQRVQEELNRRVKEMFKDESKAIVLLGLNKKRDGRSAADNNRASNAKKSRNNYSSRRSASDSLLELSIPRQMEARERKRQLEQEAFMKLTQSSLSQDEDEDED